MIKLYIYLITSNYILQSSLAGILDIFSTKEGREKNEGLKNCVCNGPSCICCIDFNVPFIDLGGPGCVRMNYTSGERSIDLNVSYGESFLQNNTITEPHPAPTCLNLLSSFAQICVKFMELLPTDDGLKGCLQFEPTLLGEAQIEFPVGCFHMGPEGMNVIESTNDYKEPLNKTNTLLVDTEETESSEIIAGLNEQDIIEAVNESTNQGIEILTNWLGIESSTNKETANTKIVSGTTPEMHDTTNLPKEDFHKNIPVL